jgi:hypothetical protein
MSPALPAGWTGTSEFGGRFLVISSPGIGFVTIDWQKRCARGGQVWAGRPIAAAAYAGLGWRERLVADAVAWLHEVGKKRQEKRKERDR